MTFASRAASGHIKCYKISRFFTAICPHRRRNWGGRGGTGPSLWAQYRPGTPNLLRPPNCRPLPPPLYVPIVAANLPYQTCSLIYILNHLELLTHLFASVIGKLMHSTGFKTYGDIPAFKTPPIKITAKAAMPYPHQVSHFSSISSKCVTGKYV